MARIAPFAEWAASSPERKAAGQAGYQRYVANMNAIIAREQGPTAKSVSAGGQGGQDPRNTSVNPAKLPIPPSMMYDSAYIQTALAQRPDLRGASVGGTYYRNAAYNPTPAPKPPPAAPKPTPAPAPSGGGGGGSFGGFSIPRVSGADNPVQPLSRADLEAEAEDIVRRGQEFINGLGNGDLLDFHANRLAMMFDPGPAFQAVFGQNAQPPGTAPSYTLPEVQPGQMTPYFGQMLGDLWNPQDIPNLPSGPGQLNWMPQHLPNPYA